MMDEAAIPCSISTGDREFILIGRGCIAYKLKAIRRYENTRTYLGEKLKIISNKYLYCILKYKIKFRINNNRMLIRFKNCKVLKNLAGFIWYPSIHKHQLCRAFRGIKKRKKTVESEAAECNRRKKSGDQIIHASEDRCTAWEYYRLWEKKEERRAHATPAGNRFDDDHDGDGDDEERRWLVSSFLLLVTYVSWNDSEIIVVEIKSRNEISKEIKAK